MIKQLSSEYPVRYLCQMLECPASTYYYQPQRQEEDPELVKAIEQHLALRPYLGYRMLLARPAYGRHWFTSDHPVVKLNYYGQGNYDLKGVWGKKGGYIFMPISPHHLLFTEFGNDLPDRLTFNI